MSLPTPLRGTGFVAGFTGEDFLAGMCSWRDLSNAERDALILRELQRAHDDLQGGSSWT